VDINHTKTQVTVKVTIPAMADRIRSNLYSDLQVNQVKGRPWDSHSPCLLQVD